MKVANSILTLSLVALFGPVAQAAGPFDRPFKISAECRRTIAQGLEKRGLELVRINSTIYIPDVGGRNTGYDFLYQLRASVRDESGDLGQAVVTINNNYNCEVRDALLVR